MVWVGCGAEGVSLVLDVLDKAFDKTSLGNIAYAGLKLESMFRAPRNEL